MTEYRSDLPARPPRFLKLPIDERGFPVPWFVAWIDGKPDFRVVRERGVYTAFNQGLCWLCGERRGVYHAFVVGPMCGINRVSSEPPSHRECAEYAVRACPFLTRPLAVRNEHGLDGTKEPAGLMIKRNPGVALLWVTKSFRPFNAGNGVLFKIGEPTELRFYAKGREATFDEINASVNSGFPHLELAASQDGPAGRAALKRQRAQFDKLIAECFA